jgi:hypothetical protein
VKIIGETHIYPKNIQTLFFVAFSCRLISCRSLLPVKISLLLVEQVFAGSAEVS